MNPLFDRKSFDPIGNKADAATLAMLRMQGRARVRGLEPSTAMKVAIEAVGEARGVFVDVGCGDSADCLVAESMGFKAYGCDLFTTDTKLPRFVKCDVVESIKTPKANVIVSQAMLDLIEPAARATFYGRVAEHLKPGGLFVCYIQWLAQGWGYELDEEREAATAVLGPLSNMVNGFTWRKPFDV